MGSTPHIATEAPGSFVLNKERTRGVLFTRAPVRVLEDGDALRQRALADTSQGCVLKPAPIAA